jgi:hypothetical protein
MILINGACVLVLDTIEEIAVLVAITEAFGKLRLRVHANVVVPTTIVVVVRIGHKVGVKELLAIPTSLGTELHVHIGSTSSAIAVGDGISGVACGTLVVVRAQALRTARLTRSASAGGACVWLAAHCLCV